MTSDFAGEYPPDLGDLPIQSEILAGIRDGVNVVSSDGIIRYTNAAFDAMFGYVPGELIGKHVAVLNAPADRSAEEVAAEITKAIVSNSEWQGEILNRRKDGSVFLTFARVGKKHVARYGEVWISVRQDITAERVATTALQASEARYRAVVEDQTEVISRFLPDGTFIFVNETFCRKFGKRADELIGKRWHPVAHPDDLPIIEAKLREMSPEDPVVLIENRVFMASGVLRWMQFVNRGFFDEDGCLKEIQAVGRDITDLKQVELRLRESEEMLHRAQSVASIGSFAMGSDPEQFTHTRVTARLFDLDENGETTFEEWFSRVHPDDQEAVGTAWRAALHGAPYDMTYRIVVRGEVVWIRALAELAFDEQGQLVRAVGTVQDVTQQKQADQALKESEQRLELALMGSGLALWDWDLATGLIVFGKRWFEMLGYAPESNSLHVDHWRRMFEPNDLKRVEAAVVQHLAGDTPVLHSQHRVRHKEGHWVALEATGKITERDAKGKPLRMVGTVRDVSQAMRLNEEGTELLKRIESLIHDATSAAPRAPKIDDMTASLTRRQRQILGMIASGMTSAAIGKQLNLATNTIVTHRKNLMAKLNLHTTADVTRFALMHGLLESTR